MLKLKTKTNSTFFFFLTAGTFFQFVSSIVWNNSLEKLNNLKFKTVYCSVSSKTGFDLNDHNIISIAWMIMFLDVVHQNDLRILIFPVGTWVYLYTIWSSNNLKSYLKIFVILSVLTEHKIWLWELMFFDLWFYNIRYQNECSARTYK